MAPAFLFGAAASQPIRINAEEYFAGPGFSFLLFHNHTFHGSQYGLQMIENGDRVLDSGDLALTLKKGVKPAKLNALRRVVDRAHQTATIYGEISGWNTGYQLICRTDGQQILITLRLDRAVDWSKVEQAGFRVSLDLGTYFTKFFQSDAGLGRFPRHYRGSVLLKDARTIRIAPGDPLHAFTISRSDGPLEILDTRGGWVSSWFKIFAPLDPGSQTKEIHIAIRPSIQPKWRRSPVIEVSQVGYEPNQPKKAIVELDPRAPANFPLELYEIQAQGTKKLVKSAIPKPWGHFLRFNYVVFDFSDVRQPGLYVLQYRGTTAGPFRIGDSAYNEAWQPTLECFLPVEMCHVEVKEGTYVWHGKCHLDDALQAPAGQNHFDGYREGPKRETKYADNEHIPGLTWGGWHDAADHDLASADIAITTLALALAREEFKPNIDRTSIERAQREVFLGQPDGRPDLLEQAQYGAESLLASYRISGHIFPGVIENNQFQYGTSGDPVNITDNLIYDPALKPNQVEGNRSGKFDDRWVFTNRNTGLQYESAQALAAVSRILRKGRPELADEALHAAEHLWAYEQSHSPDFFPGGAYVPRSGKYRSQEMKATAELLITTGEEKYRKHLIELTPVIASMPVEAFGAFDGPGWTLVRVLPLISDSAFRSSVISAAKKWKTLEDQEAASNPWGVHMPENYGHPDYKLGGPPPAHPLPVWGIGVSLLEDTLTQYYFNKQLPQIYNRDALLAAVNFILGYHPANNKTYVAGVGTNSPLVMGWLQGPTWSYLPGGVMAGASLVQPDFMEMKNNPYVWYQTEAWIEGAGSYIFDVLAARKLLSQNTR